MPPFSAFCAVDVVINSWDGRYKIVCIYIVIVLDFTLIIKFVRASNFVTTFYVALPYITYDNLN